MISKQTVTRGHEFDPCVPPFIATYVDFIKHLVWVGPMLSTFHVAMDLCVKRIVRTFDKVVFST